MLQRSGFVASERRPLAFYLRWLPGEREFLYPVTLREKVGVRARQVLSASAERQRLEQARQFPRDPLVR